MNKILKYGIILFVITAVSSGMVSAVYNVTLPVIVEQKIEKDNNARKDLLPDAAEFEQLEGDYPESILEVYKGLDSQGDIIGYTIKTSTKGYGGPIEITTGITTDGTINGIMPGSMSETPGLGAKASEPDFYTQYDEKPADDIKVIKNGTPADDEIVAISGATITSDAVNVGVMEAINIYNEKLQGGE